MVTSSSYWVHILSPLGKWKRRGGRHGFPSLYLAWEFAHTWAVTETGPLSGAHVKGLKITGNAPGEVWEMSIPNTSPISS